jgi:WD40 repeat protein
MIDSLKREPRLLAVLGPSGSGKSSVVRAGLVPALEQGKVPNSDKWGIITIRPISQPFEQLDNSGLSKSQESLESAVRTWLEYHSEKTRLVLVIDQFEELLVSTPEEIRQKFIKELAHLLNTSVAITVVLTLRDDFYSRFLQDASVLASWLERGLVNIPTTLDEDELQAMVVGPAKMVGLKFEAGLVDVIISDAVEADRTNEKARSTILPLLEFALTQLWEKRQGEGLTHNAYQAINGVTGGLVQWADRAYYALNTNEQKLAKDIFCKLVHLGSEEERTPDTRRIQPINKLGGRRESVSVGTVIGKLVQARLLSTQRDLRTGQEFIEIIHEALLREWGLLKIWVEQFRNREQIARERQRRQITIGLSIGLIVMALLSVFALVQRNMAINAQSTALAEGAARATALANEESAKATAQAERDRAEKQAQIALSRQLIAQIPNKLDQGNWELAMLMAIEAGRANESVDSFATLRQVIAHPGRTQFIINNVDRARWNFDGSCILTISYPDNMAVSVWNSHTGEKLFTISNFTGRVANALWSPDGTRILTVTEDGIAEIWDAENGKRLKAETFTFLKPINSEQVSWRPNRGQILIVGCSQLDPNDQNCSKSSARMWDIASNDKLLNLFTIGADVNGIIWDSLGTQILTYSWDRASLWNPDTGAQLEGSILSNPDKSTSSVSNQGESQYPGLIPGQSFSLESLKHDGSLYLTYSCYLSDYTLSPGNCLSGAIEVREKKPGNKIISLLGVSGNMDGELSPNEKQVLTISNGSTARVWDLASGKEIPEDFSSVDRFAQLESSTNGTRVLGVDNQVVKIWDKNTGQELITLHPREGLDSAIWSPDGNRVLTLGYSQTFHNTLQVWNADSGQMVFELSGNVDLLTQLNPTSDYLLTRNDQYLVQAWDLNDGTELLSIPESYEAQWSPDGTYFLTVDFGGEEVHAWNITSGEEFATFHTSGQILEILWDKSGNQIATRNIGDTVQIWAPKVGKNTFTIPADFTTMFASVSWHPHGRHILIARQNGIEVWDTQDGSMTLSFKPNLNHIHHAEWNPSGNRIMVWNTFRNIGKVMIFDSQTGTEVGNLSSVINVRGALWEPRGNRFISFSDQVRIWDSEIALELFSLPSVDSAIWNADGSRIITTSSEGTRQWYTNISDLIDAACQQAPRNMTHAEWDQYIGENYPYRATCPNLPIPTG